MSRWEGEGNRFAQKVEMHCLSIYSCFPKQAMMLLSQPCYSQLFILCKNYWQKRIQPALLASVQPGSVPSAPLTFLSPPSHARRKGGPRSGKAARAFFKRISKLGAELRSLVRVYLTRKQDQWPPPLLMCLGFRCQLSFWSRSLPSSSCFGMWGCKGSQSDCHLLWQTTPEEKPQAEARKVIGFLCTLNSLWSWLFLRANKSGQGSFQPQQALSRAWGQGGGWLASLPIQNLQ